MVILSLWFSDILCMGLSVLPGSAGHVFHRTARGQHVHNAGYVTARRRGDAAQSKQIGAPVCPTLAVSRKKMKRAEFTVMQDARRCFLRKHGKWLSDAEHQVNLPSHTAFLPAPTCRMAVCCTWAAACPVQAHVMILR